MRAGVDWARLEADLAAHDAEIAALLGDTDRLARGLGLAGTPSLAVGPYLVGGRQTAARLRELVTQARR